MKLYGRIAYLSDDKYYVTDITTDLRLLDDEDLCYTELPIADTLSLSINGDLNPDWIEFEK